MMSRVVVLMLGLLGGLVPGAVAAGPPTEYSADQTVQVLSVTYNLKVHVQGEKTRVDDGRGGVTISRKDLGKVWLLWPAMRTYMETPIPPEDPRYAPDPAAREERKLLGEEIVNGYQTEKFEVTVKTLQGQLTTSYQWTAKALDGLVVRRKSELGQSELRNVAVGPQPPDLFEIPSGFTKFGVGVQKPPGGPSSPPGARP